MKRLRRHRLLLGLTDRMPHQPRLSGKRRMRSDQLRNMGINKLITIPSIRITNYSPSDRQTDTNPHHRPPTKSAPAARQHRHRRTITKLIGQHRQPRRLPNRRQPSQQQRPSTPIKASTDTDVLAEPAPPPTPTRLRQHHTTRHRRHTAHQRRRRASSRTTAGSRQPRQPVTPATPGTTAAANAPTTDPPKPE